MHQNIYKSSDLSDYFRGINFSLSKPAIFYVDVSIIDFSYIYVFL